MVSNYKGLNNKFLDKHKVLNDLALNNMALNVIASN
jgi:hypothetical protein